MKILKFNKKKPRGGGAVELVGMVCIMTIMGCLLIPLVSSLVDDAKLVATVQSIKATQAATLAYYQRYGKFGLTAGSGITWTNRAHDFWDREVLAREQFTEHTFSSRLATNCYVRLVQVYANQQGDVLFDNLNTGHLGGMYANNGIYDLTHDYSSVPRQNGLFYAKTPTRAWRGHACGGGSRRTARPAWSVATGFVGIADWALPDLGGFGSKHTRPAGQPWTAFSRTLAWLLSSGVGPLQSCYPEVTPPPPPALGGGGGGGSGTTPIHDSAHRPPLNNDASSGNVVVEIVLEGITVENAYRLSKAIDGTGQSNWAYWDSVGRVKYDFISSPSGTAFVYLMHK